MNQPFPKPSNLPEDKQDLQEMVSQTVSEARKLISSLSQDGAEALSGTNESGNLILSRALSFMAQANETIVAQQSRILQLESLLIQDEMTGLLNRRGMEQQFTREQARMARRQSLGYALVLFDLDKFKAINDTHGHPAGDATLRHVGDFFLRTVRTTDAIARMGGDEFALLLTDIESGVAAQRAAAITAAVNGLSLDWHGHTLKIRASHGMAHTAEATDFNNLYALADATLYTDKSIRQAS